jgi:hypothetical protein
MWSKKLPQKHRSAEFLFSSCNPLIISIRIGVILATGYLAPQFSPSRSDEKRNNFH